MATTNVRVPGGGNTYIVAGFDDGVRLEFLSDFTDTPGTPVGAATEIHPIGYPYPIEIATPYAQRAGTINFTVWSTWGKDGWVSAFLRRGADGNISEQQDSSSPWADYVSSWNKDVRNEPVDLREVFEAQRKSNRQFTVKKFELGKNGEAVRVKEYQNCVITNIQAGETVRNDTMTQTCRIDVMYTNVNIVKA